MLVILAPDKFKGSLTAPQVADALADGLSTHRGVRCSKAPIADGGDGTVAAFLAAGWEHVHVEAAGPTGVLGRTEYCIRDRTAVVELASVCGLERLPGGRRLDPLGASTFGLGTVIGHALSAGAREVIIGLGGSASTDGGAGLLSALGARITDAAGRELRRGGGGLLAVDHIDLTGMTAAIGAASFQLACDVRNPLLGSNGAVAVYGPQKGASAAELVVLEAALQNWARVIKAATGTDFAETPGAGAAGGAGFGIMSVLGAQPRSGIELVLASIGFSDLLVGADLVITGEGSLDGQSLQGKAPTGVVAAARAAGVPVVAVAGRCELSAEQLASAGFAACYTLAELEPERARSISNATALLRIVGERVAKDFC